MQYQRKYIALASLFWKSFTFWDKIFCGNMIWNYLNWVWKLFYPPLEVRVSFSNYLFWLCLGESVFAIQLWILGGKSLTIQSAPAPRDTSDTRRLTSVTLVATDSDTWYHANKQALRHISNILLTSLKIRPDPSCTPETLLIISLLFRFICRCGFEKLFLRWCNGG